MDYKEHEEFIATALMSPLEELVLLLNESKLTEDQANIAREIISAAKSGNTNAIWKLIEYAI